MTDTFEPLRKYYLKMGTYLQNYARPNKEEVAQHFPTFNFRPHLGSLGSIHGEHRVIR